MLLWTVPWWAFALGLFAGLFFVTVEGLYRQSERHVEELRELKEAHEVANEATVAAHAATVRTLVADIAALRGMNLGIKLVASELNFEWDHPDVDGVNVIVTVERLVNQNSTDASLEIALKAPIPVGQSTTVLNLVARPDLKPASHLKATAPQLMPPISVRARENRGPAFMVFNFRQTQLAPFPFHDLWKGRTSEELYMTIRASEMYFEITDIANDGEMHTVDAPGTIDKRMSRLGGARLRPSVSQRDDVSN